MNKTHGFVVGLIFFKLVPGKQSRPLLYSRLIMWPLIAARESKPL